MGITLNSSDCVENALEMRSLVLVEREVSWPVLTGSPIWRSARGHPGRFLCEDHILASRFCWHVRLRLYRYLTISENSGV